MAAAHIRAAAIVVLRAGHPPKIAAYGTADIENNVPASSNTAFQLASATKLFTGILTMRMVEQGKLFILLRGGEAPGPLKAAPAPALH